MMRPLMFRAATVAALFAGLLARPASAADKTPSAKLLPPTVFAYVSVPDVTTLKQRVNASSFGALLKDPKLQPSFEQIKEKFTEAGGKVEEQLGVSLKDLLNVPSGELAFAVCDVQDGNVGVVVLIDYGTNDSTVKKLLEKAEASLSEKGAERSTQEFEGTEIVVYSSGGGDDEADEDAADDADDDLDVEGEDATEASGPGNDVAWFQKDQRLVFGNTPTVLEAVLARWDGSHGETFAKNEVYGYIVEKTKSGDRDPVFSWYFDPIGSLQAGLSRAQGGPAAQLQVAAAFLPTLGLNKLKAVGGSMDVATDEFDSIGKTFIYVEQPPTGVLGAFQFPPSELAPPDWVPESAGSYAAANWDVPAAVQSIKTLVDTFQGPGAFDQVMNRAANNANGPKINPQKDVLDQLSGRLEMVSYPITVPRNAPQGQPAVQQPIVFAIGVKDEKKMQDLLGRLSQTQGFPGSKRDFQGTTVYELPMAGAGGAGQKVAFAVAKKALFFSTDTARMEEALRGSGGSPLAKSQAYQKIAKHFPDRVSIISFQDQQDQLKSMYEAARSGQFGQEVQGFDFSKLPPFEDIKKYFRTTGSYAVPDANGVMFESFSLKLDE